MDERIGQEMVSRKYVRFLRDVIYIIDIIITAAFNKWHIKYVCLSIVPDKRALPRVSIKDFQILRVDYKTKLAIIIYNL